MLKSLKFEDGEPSQADQARVTQEIADLLRRAKAIGRVHVMESMTWGGVFSDLWQSAKDIVSNFVARIVGWIGGQSADDLTEEDIQAEVDTLAETVGDTEIAAAVEQAVMDELDAQGFMSIQWYAQPGACKLCQRNADQGPVPIGSTFQSGDATPPAHPLCRCSIGAQSEEK